MLLASALLSSTAPAAAQVSVGIGINLPGVSIGINVPAYPELVPVPGYPVYYAPRLESNYFFYDGMYWVYQQDNWYASYWYNGPWGMVAPHVVPVFILRIPVRYYRQPPPYFRGWRPEAPPRWGEHWGNDWEQHRSGWDHWDHRSAPRPAPLPTYQRQYSGARYPSAEMQPQLHSKNYKYQPQEPVVKLHYEAQRAIAAPPPPQSKQAAPQKGSGPSQQQRAPTRPPPQQAGPDAQQRGQPPEQAPAQHQQQAPSAQGQDKGSQGKGSGQEPKQGQGQDHGQDKGEGGGKK
jgi:hypothetical protein